MIIFWGQNYEFGLENGAPNPSKMRPKREKTDVEKQAVFGVDFYIVSASIWEGFWEDFWCQKASKQQKRRSFENVKNSDFP